MWIEYNSLAFSLRSNYSDWANFSANFCGFWGVVWSVQRNPTAVNFSFLDRRHYFFFQVASHLS
jgi:hypothetical protein